MLNPYINNHFYSETQDLVEDLTVEYIQAMGQDVHYIPREHVKLDQLFGEDVLSKFQDAYVIEMYWDSAQEWTGPNRFFSKFGLQDQRQAEFIVSRKRFGEEVSVNRPEIKKPRVGDIILLSAFEPAPFNIVWVEEYSLQQRPLNKPYTWKLTCELLTYSHEDHDTGLPAFDSIETDYSSIETAFNVPMADNSAVETEKSLVKDPDYRNPFGDF